MNWESFLIVLKLILSLQCLELIKMKQAKETVKSATPAGRRESTHLYFQEKKLKIIPKLNNSKEVLVLYLYDNLIQKINNLDDFKNLLFLYLQNNQITVIENLQNLQKLKKLYVGHNHINVLEGLMNNTQLEELHIEKQILPDGSSFCFDPRSVMALKDSLQVLNISHNNISSLSILSCLKHLRIIDASYNDLHDIKDICETLQNWFYLKEASFLGNPVIKKHRYREDIIAKSKNLEMLDGKRVTEINRSFMRRFETERMLKGSKPNINIADTINGLPNNYPLALQKAVSASMVRNHGSNLFEDLSTLDEKDAVYIAWKALPKRRPVAKSQEQKKTADFVKKTMFVNSLPKL